LLKYYASVTSNRWLMLKIFGVLIIFVSGASRLARSWWFGGTWRCCPGVLASWRPGVLASWRPGVLVSSCLSVCLCFCPAVLLSCAPAVLLSCCPAVLLSCCPAVLLSCCPAIRCSPVLLLSCFPDFLLSCCPVSSSCGVALQAELERPSRTRLESHEEALTPHLSFSSSSSSHDRGVTRRVETIHAAATPYLAPLSPHRHRGNDGG
jgi:hypothetical protein